ncbi:non-heme iron oxygenase ferredoxin subunit [Bradyrhizobium sp. 41S5]|uniref:non-heme iron oxygenase ferredoxin subunit n=1 Tax=Bradyrhizobium sp. 41S5 TaxID=1404443 RepID=UPI001E35774F|nr:non-heme iron oxygenase ferredoxin subunit [Bradyrhizobium sp. 41S5]UFX44138.1 non-heme iron oxygenase ferredoxin subunit [Bradyrhizobium sp. 41S5]
METMTDLAGTWHPAGALGSIAPGEMAAKEAGTSQFVVYNIDGAIFATDNVCTHAYALLSDGWLDDDVVECPLHGGQFNVKTGKALCDPLDCDLRIYETRIVDGMIEVLLPADGSDAA